VAIKKINIRKFTPMKTLLSLLVALIASFITSAQPLQTVTNAGNTSDNTINITGGANAGVSGSNGIVISGFYSSAITNDTRAVIGWKSSNNSITNGVNGTLLLQARSLIDAANDFPIDFATGQGTPQLRMRITGNGNVGIGNATPRATFDVNQTTDNTLSSVLSRLYEGNTTGIGTYLGVQSYATQPVDAIITGRLSFSLEHRFYGQLNNAVNFYRGSGQTGGFITFATNNGSEKVRIDQDGDVGIGTPNPLYKLDVAGGAVVLILLE
jgi:hypothetical protein